MELSDEITCFGTIDDRLFARDARDNDTLIVLYITLTALNTYRIS